MEGVLKSWNAGEKNSHKYGGEGELTAQRFSSVLLPVDDIQIPACKSGPAGMLV